MDDPQRWTVVWNLPTLPEYRDRLQMLARLSAQVGRLYVLTSAVPPEIAAEVAGWPRLRLVVLGRPWFRQRAHGWLDAHHARLSIVHDTFGHLAEWMLARRGARAVRYVSTQYTSNAGWLDGVRRGPEMVFDAHYAALRMLTYWSDRVVCAAADEVLVLGPGHDRELCRHHPIEPARVGVLPSEVDVARFRPAPRRLSADPVVLFTGRLQRTKGLDVLIRAVAALRRGPCPRVRLVLIGRVLPRDASWLDRLIEESALGEALEVIPGLPQDGLIEWYRRATVLGFPSLFEGSPRSVREALACGCRAVLSDIPGHRGIDPDGQFVRFAPVGDAAAWYAALAAALAEPPVAAAARAAAGVARMRDVHGLAAVSTHLLGVYRRLRSEPPRP